MNYKKIGLFQALALLCLIGTAQKVQPLPSGSVLPLIEAQLYTNDSVSQVKTIDYKGKLLVIDFWGVNCVSCVAAMPEMLELKAKFKDSLQFLLVTRNSKRQVDSLFKKYEAKPKASRWVQAGRQLPFIYEDSVFYKLFPHKVLGTQVWVDTDQRYQAITYGSSLNEATIRQMFQGLDDDLVKQHVVDFDIDDPLSWLDPKKKLGPAFQGYSFFTRYLEVGGGNVEQVRLRKDSISGKVIGITCTNLPVISLYQWAYMDHASKYADILDQKRIIVASQKDLFSTPDNSQFDLWARANCYSYVLKLTDGSIEDLLATMKKQLDDYLGLRSTMEKRKVKVLVLKGKYRNHLNKKTTKSNEVISLVDRPIGDLYTYLLDLAKSIDPKLILLDATNEGGRISITFPWKSEVKELSLADVRKSLQLYNLDLSFEEREVEFLVIRDKK